MSESDGVKVCYYNQNNTLVQIKGVIQGSGAKRVPGVVFILKRKINPKTWNCGIKEYGV